MSSPASTFLKPALLLCLLLSSLYADDFAEGRPEVRVAMLAPGNAYQQSYPGALPSLLEHIARHTHVQLATEPLQLQDFTDERLFQSPFVYANYADRKSWDFSEKEKQNLKAYLERGGFLFIDAGITASFLRENPMLGQNHSYAEWDAVPELKQAFEEILPGHSFAPLPRTDPLYHAFYQGLPDASLLPDSVREYTIREKWPDGTYSAVALRVHGRIAVLCTPIIAMGWAKNTAGQWLTHISFRVLESTQGLNDLLQTAAYSGVRFEAVREDGAKDIIYCQNARPAWVNEPGGIWRVFRYYSSREISDFAHVFYTRLGANILIYALAQ